MDPREFPTKGNLIAAKNSLTLAKQGYDLMDKKRNILIRELMDLIDEAKDIQEEIDTTFTRAYACLQRANIQHGISKVEELAYTVPIEDSIQIQTRSIMGTEIPLVQHQEKPMELHLFEQVIPQNIVCKIPNLRVTLPCGLFRNISIQVVHLLVEKPVEFFHQPIESDLFFLGHGIAPPISISVQIPRCSPRSGGRPAGRKPHAGILCCGGRHPAYQWGRRASSSCGSPQLKSRPR